MIVIFFFMMHEMGGRGELTWFVWDLASHKQKCHPQSLIPPLNRLHLVKVVARKLHFTFKVKDI